ncbi:sugar phosphate isomerase/epimerase family protein [Fodinibius sediminis]|uniref:Sugar phosphate isomerase/epimerase n=1 Tax=Fodinibius sediminis TaxID=1214077 RepID=A0A521DMK1_9BACT|nr:sugar phosphate isomerase/epimerase [Fodinibius sediminis]SMO72906.1 Sugar phosphate isomerase/epimerase [Fodinibius sediminis]
MDNSISTENKGMKIGFHTDAFNTSFKNFEFALQWAKENNVHYIEPGVIDGVSWIHGLGYQPHIALYEDPLLLKNKMKEEYDVQFSQIDAAFPLSGKDGPLYGIPYVLKSIPWAKHAGCPCIAVTDGLHKPESMTDEEAMDMMKRGFERIIEVAEAYEIQINIEVHGYFTTNPDMLEKMLNFCDSEYLGLNMDTGNSYIAGRDPVEFLKEFINKVNHVHIKDVSEELDKMLRGKDTGIALSHCAIGAGVNADNIRRILSLLHDSGYTGVLSMECEGKGGPMIERSLEWLRATMDELSIPETT